VLIGCAALVFGQEAKSKPAPKAEARLKGELEK